MQKRKRQKIVEAIENVLAAGAILAVICASCAVGELLCRMMGVG